MKTINLLIATLVIGMSGTAFAKSKIDLLNLHISEDGISFQVISTGCSATKESYSFEVTKHSPDLNDPWDTEYTSEIEFFRIHPDQCESGPQLRTLNFSLEELGIKRNRSFSIKNKVAVVRW